MQTARQDLRAPINAGERARASAEHRAGAALLNAWNEQEELPQPGRKIRVYLATANPAGQEALARNLTRKNLVVISPPADQPFDAKSVSNSSAEVLLLASRGSFAESVRVIREVRQVAAAVQIVLVVAQPDENELLGYVREGVRGYLPATATAGEVAKAVRDVQAGEAVCSGSFCGLLFHEFENEAALLRNTGAGMRLRLTRRELELIPLIAQGLSNKEIAKRFLLCEQTVKNHLYRMKHKLGAESRMGIAQVCEPRTHAGCYELPIK